jgi:hypothetical protein
MEILRNKGFDGRIFLTKEEWETYCRRKPVRYIRKQKITTCEICGKSEEQGNLFQNAHMIGFDFGITYLALTPDFLDLDIHIKTAHKINCNKKCELSLKQILIYLKKNNNIINLPNFLSHQILKEWSNI